MLALLATTAVLTFHPAPILHHQPVLRRSIALAPARGGQVALRFGRRQQRFRISWPGQRNQGLSFPGQRRGGRRRLWFRSQPQSELPGPVGMAATGFGLVAVFAVATSAWGQKRVRRDHGFANFPTARFAPDGALEEARTNTRRIFAVIKPKKRDKRDTNQPHSVGVPRRTEGLPGICHGDWGITAVAPEAPAATVCSRGCVNRDQGFHVLNEIESGGVGGVWSYH